MKSLFLTVHCTQYVLVITFSEQRHWTVLVGNQIFMFCVFCNESINLDTKALKFSVWEDDGKLLQLGLKKEEDQQTRLLLE